MLCILYCILVGDFRRNTEHLVHTGCWLDMIFYTYDLHIFYHSYSLRFHSIQFYGNQYVDFRGNRAHNYILVGGQLLSTQHAFHKSLLHIRQYTGSTIKIILIPLLPIELYIYINIYIRFIFHYYLANCICLTNFCVFTIIVCKAS